MKILLAVDGSPCSEVAVDEICRRPWPTDSSVKVLNAFEPPMPPTTEGWALLLNRFDELDQAARKEAQVIVERTVEKLRTKLDTTTTITGKCLPGPARPVILDEAESWGADLMMVGSHGHGRLERFLLGSVSQSVVSHAKCSVEVVRCGHVCEDGKQTDPAREKK
jgi:nucleotide-binding universal stress UspA family protein